LIKLNFKKALSGKTKRRWLVFLAVSLPIFIWWWFFSLPKPLFDSPYSLVVETEKGELVGALISEDEQWRFPAPDSLPETFIEALLAFEDKRFYHHPGVDPLAIARALRDNLKEGRVVSGGSTISMQLARMVRQSPNRSLRAKFIETLMALRIEAAYTKEEILQIYAGHAPFGGNVVGLDAASWRYFGQSPDQLSWVEAATLAVLPNSPSLIHFSRNRDLLLKKRNLLLKRLHQEGHFDSLSLSLYTEELLPDRPHPMPNHSPQLIQRLKKTTPGNQHRISSTLDLNLQRKVNHLAAEYHQLMKHNHIQHLAVLVIDVNRNEVLAYIGNVPGADPFSPGNQVDLIKAERSTGSILKPFLYAALLSEGEMMPTALTLDIPTQFGGYSPQNFSLKYDGAIPAHRALARSLNVPAVRMLQSYGTEKFHHLLRRHGFSTADKSTGHYGLSLILGGAEGTLWEIASMYAGMARTINDFPILSARYSSSAYDPPAVQLKKSRKGRLSDHAPLRAGAIWHTLSALTETERPFSEHGWERSRPFEKIAWKTGTSFGFRDAWSVGLTPEYTVAVWVGNASGEGRPGLTGVEAAAPLMFEVFKHLGSEGKWFATPHDDLRPMSICSKSGFKPGPKCREQIEISAPLRGDESPVCPYHQLVHTDLSGEYRVHTGCQNFLKIKTQSHFVLPPAAAQYYAEVNANYRPLPPYRIDCAGSSNRVGTAIDLIYPRHKPSLLIPVELDGNINQVVFEAAHQQPHTTLYWHLNDLYLGSTTEFHQMVVNAPPGQYSLTLVDKYGNRLAQQLEIVQR